jgi:hypothetical protein
MNTWKFGNSDIYFTLAQYDSGDMAVQAWLVEDEFFAVPYARISINIVDAPKLAEGQFYLKDWSENAEIAQAMKQAKLIELVKGAHPVAAGFCSSIAYQFTSKGLEYIAK